MSKKLYEEMTARTMADSSTSDEIATSAKLLPNPMLSVRACEGNCLETHGTHKGEVIAVILSGQGWKDTKFNYCQNAIEEDERRGFSVRHDR